MKVMSKNTYSCKYEQENLILNPVENLPLTFGDEAIAKLQGLYITDKSRTEEQKKDSKMQFLLSESWFLLLKKYGAVALSN